MPTDDLGRFRHGRHDGYRSDPEVLAAIEEVSRDTLPLDIISPITWARANQGCRLWGAPTTEEIVRVMTLAWFLAGPEKKVLRWGATTFHRADYPQKTGV